MQGIAKFRLSNNVKQKILEILYFMMASFFLINIKIEIRFDIKIIILSLIISLVYAFTFEKKIIMNKFNLIIAGCFVLIGGCFAISAIKFNVLGYAAYAIIFSVLISAFAVTKINWEMNITALIKSAYYINWIVVIISFILYPNDIIGGYYSFVENSNYLAMLLSLYIICLLILLYISKSKRYLVLIGIDIMVLIFTESRTGMLVLVSSFIIYCIFLLKGKQINRKRIIVTISILMVTMLGTICIFGFFTPTAYKFISGHIKQLERPIPEELKKDFSHDTLISFSNKMGKGISNTEGRFTSGRAEIWGNYLSEIGIQGHEDEHIKIKENDKLVERDAHNSILQISFSAGIFAGIALIIIFLMIIYKSIKILIYNRSVSVYDVFVIMVCCNYIINSMFAAIYAPYAALNTVIFYFFLSGVRHESNAI